MSDRNKILKEILEERTRQCDLPGIEYDVTNTPNDWSAIISSYVLRNINRKNVKPEIEEFRTDMIAAAAIILAAVEHIDAMNSKNLFR